MEDGVLLRAVEFVGVWGGGGVVVEVVGVVVRGMLCLESKGVERVSARQRGLASNF